MKNETPEERMARRWAACQRVMGAFLSGLEQSAVAEEAYEDAAGWRDMSQAIQAAAGPEEFEQLCDDRPHAVTPDGKIVPIEALP